MICPICKSNNTDLLLDYGQYPYFTVPVKKSDKKKLLTEYNNNQLFGELKYATCKDCAHVYINEIPDQKIIDDLYSNYYSYPSPLKKEFEPTRDLSFINYFKKFIHPICSANNLSNLLEIGCFDGFVLKNFSQIGYAVTGCDPSDGAVIGQNFGINIRKEFFDPRLFLNDKITFDIVITRHLIEHMADPKKFIFEIESILEPTGLLIIETPNVQDYVTRGSLGVFSLQHITLFSISSLRFLLGECGFRIHTFIDEGDNLIIVAKKGREKVNHSLFFEGYSEVFRSFQIVVRQRKKRILQMLQNYSANDKTICIWGAGGAGLAALTLCGIPSSEINYFIDSDSKKWGMAYLSYSIPIISPKEALKKNPGLIIITSMYYQTIQKAIKEMGFKSSLLTIYPTVFFERA